MGNFRALALRLASALRSRFGMLPLTLAGSGNSGLAIIGGICALEPLYRPAAIRKLGDTGHDSYSVNGPNGIREWVFVDDLISTGNTLRRVIASIDEYYPAARLIGIALYNDWDYPHAWNTFRRLGLQGVPLYSLRGENAEREAVASVEAAEDSAQANVNEQ